MNDSWEQRPWPPAWGGQVWSTERHRRDIRRVPTWTGGSATQRLDDSVPLRPVAVAVSGRSDNWDALDWAAAEAAARQTVLRIVHVFSWPLAVDPICGANVAVGDPGAIAAADGVAERAARRARIVVPGLDLETRIVPGSPGPELSRACGDAVVIVLGHGSRPRLAAAIGRAPGQYLARRGDYPVVVVRLAVRPRRGPSSARVVVAVDDPTNSSDLLRIGFASARRRRIGLTVVHAWAPSGRGERDMFGGEPTSREVRKRRQLDALVETWSAVNPDVEVRRRVVRGHTLPVVRAEALDAAMLVIGTHGQTGGLGRLLGSVAAQWLIDPQCSVVIVRLRGRRGRSSRRVRARSGYAGSSDGGISPHSQPHADGDISPSCPGSAED